MCVTRRASELISVPFDNASVRLVERKIQRFYATIYLKYICYKMQEYSKSKFGSRVESLIDNP